MVQSSDVTGSNTVLYEKREGTAWITLNRPERMNALNLELRGALSRALREAVRDPDILCAVVSGGGGRAFSAGNDLKAVGESYAAGIAPGSEARATDNMGSWDFPKPIIAAIDGYCVAGGLELALGCDIRIATEKSSFGLPEIKRGRTAGPGLIHLGRMIPLGEAKLIQLTGGHVPAARAYQIGLIQALLPDRDALFAEAERLANEIAMNAPLSVEATKRVVSIAHIVPPEYAQRVLTPERELINRSEDIQEGVQAFVEKRAPIWKRR